jgi:hypothetical protein
MVGCWSGAKGLPIWRSTWVGVIVRAHRSASATSSAKLWRRWVWVTVRRRLRHSHSIRSGCRPAPAVRPARRAGRAAAATPWGCGCRGCPRSPWRSCRGPGNPPRRGAAGRTAGRRGGLRPAPSPGAHRASRPAQSRTACSSCRAPGPAADPAGRRATTPGSGSGAGQPRPRLAATDPRLRAAPADRAGPRATGRRRGWHRGQDRMPVEAPVRPRRQAAPPPSAVFAHPGWAWALRCNVQRGRLHTYPARCSASLTVSIPARWPVTAAR